MRFGKTHLVEFGQDGLDFKISPHLIEFKFIKIKTSRSLGNLDKSNIFFFGYLKSQKENKILFDLNEDLNLKLRK